MAKRVISAFVGLALLGVILTFYETILFNIAVAVVSVLAVYELFAATGYIKEKALSVVCLTYSASFPFLNYAGLKNIYRPVLFLFVLVLFVLMFRYYERANIEELALAFMVSTLIPYSFSTMLFIRDLSLANGRFMILLALGGAWLGDTGAFFVGTFLGKHKLCPKISPKKTVEGLIGGIITTALGFALLGYIYYCYKSTEADPVHINYIGLMIVGAISSVLGVVGDLSASMIKRQCKIKDFGSIMPGHGGVLDRFDSVLITAPFMYVMFSFSAETNLFTLIK